MLDTSKLPHLQPQSAKSKGEPAQESLAKQTARVFLSKKGSLYVFAAVVLIYFSLCLQGEHLLRQGLYGFFKDLGQNGFGITYNAPSSYLAFKSGINLDDLVITAPERMGGWVLKTGRITISSMPFTPRLVTIRLNGTHSLATKSIGDIRLVVGQGEAELHLPDKKRPASFSLTLKKVQTASPKSMEGFFLSSLELTAGREAEHAGTAEKTEKESFRFSLSSDAVHLPAYISRHLPPLLEKLDLQGTVSGLPEDAPSFLTGWLNQSGTIEVERGNVVWPPFSARLNGTFGFNDDFDMIGAGVMKSYGFFDLLDMFRNGDYLRSRRVSVAKVVLGEQVRKDDGQKDSLTSDFSIQSGKIYTGQVLLYDRHEK